MADTTSRATARSDSDSGSEASDPLDLKNDEGWEDVEEDTEALSFVSLFDDKTFPHLQSMLEYMRTTYDFDLKKVHKELGLDFFESMKLVNYIRSEAKSGNKVTEIRSKDAFADDMYLQPVLDGDAVLFSLEDLDGGVFDDDKLSSQEGDHSDPNARVQELEAQLREAKQTIDSLRGIGQRLLESQADTPQQPLDIKSAAEDKAAGDDSYFNSYAFRDIHETMLKDTARTDAYRDFVYDNKELFKGKTVLDVGCGTAILSMMCAKAGAKHVIAVDNSDIIQKARANVFANGLSDTITCVHGKIEEIELPVDKVDIIISEWMGYALLYEAMLDSVIWARDRYLAPGGLMVPCDMYLCIGPLADPTLIMDKVSFWNDVYGFDMTSMQEGIFNDVVLMDAQESTIAADLKSKDNRHEFLHLDLYTTKPADLVFSGLGFEMKLNKEVDALDGFVIWFDTIFGRYDRGENVNELSTGPHAKYTHWMQTLLLIDHLKKHGEPLKTGQVIKGSVGYERPKDADRQLKISLSWDAAESSEQGKQTWKLE